MVPAKKLKKKIKLKFTNVTSSVFVFVSRSCRDGDKAELDFLLHFWEAPQAIIGLKPDLSRPTSWAALSQYLTNRTRRVVKNGCVAFRNHLRSIPHGNPLKINPHHHPISVKPMDRCNMSSWEVEIGINSAVLGVDQVAEMQNPDEDWTGQADPILRRKLQNRLHQRAWRMFAFHNKIHMSL